MWLFFIGIEHTFVEFKNTNTKRGGHKEQTNCWGGYIFPGRVWPRIACPARLGRILASLFSKLTTSHLHVEAQPLACHIFRSLQACSSSSLHVCFLFITLIHLLYPLLSPATCLSMFCLCIAGCTNLYLRELSLGARTSMPHSSSSHHSLLITHPLIRY